MPKTEQAKNREKNNKDWFLEHFPHSNDNILWMAVANCVQTFKLPERVRPIHLCDIKEKELDWESSPGQPWTDSGFQTRLEVVSDHKSLQSIRRIWHFLKEGQDIDLPHSIFGENGIEYPFTVFLQEACYAIPLMEAYACRINITSDLAVVCDSCCQYFYGDTCNAKLQNNIPPWLIRMAFMIMLIITKYQGGGIPDASKLCSGVWIEFVKYFINTPIRLKNGVVCQKTKGVPNGSPFAKLIISVVNHIVTTYCTLKYRKKIADTLDMLELAETEQQNRKKDSYGKSIKHRN